LTVAARTRTTISELHAVNLYALVRTETPRHTHPLIDRHLRLTATHILHVSAQVQHATAQAQQPVTQRLHIALQHNVLNLADATARGLYLHLLSLQSTAIPFAYRQHFLAGLWPCGQLLAFQLNSRTVHH